MTNIKLTSSKDILGAFTTFVFYAISAIAILYIFDDVVGIIPITGKLGEYVFQATMFGIPAAFLLSVISWKLIKRKKFKYYTYTSGGLLLFMVLLVVVIMRFQVF